ncbi:MAG: arylesterase, partial [Vulcanococcus sp.]
YSNEHVRQYEALLKEACMEADLPFLPLLDSLLSDPSWLQWICPDGIHLNSEGHRQIYERVRHWSPLLSWADLQPTSAGTPLY